MALSMSDAVNESICINTVLLILSVGKILTYLSLLVGNEKSCDTQLIYWFLLMFIHDILYVIYTTMVLKTI
jgi:hypothetical protein